MTNNDKHQTTKIAAGIEPAGVTRPPSHQARSCNTNTSDKHIHARGAMHAIQATKQIKIKQRMIDSEFVNNG